jgi:hexosaminidase
MKRFLLLLSAFVFATICDAQKSRTGVIPLPVILKKQVADSGSFHLTAETWLVDSLNEFPAELKVFNEQMQKVYGFTLPIAHESKKTNFICVYHGHEGNRNIRVDAYTLDAKKNSIVLLGYPTGVFYGLETLFQMMTELSPGQLNVPARFISDYPRYEWRGMHLDVCRHFFSKADVEKYLDYLAFYKFNVFHWHLTDDQGWRIQIKKYPLLTVVGSVRSETVIGHNSDSAKYDGISYSGFYSQADIKEIVAYATERHITVVPEIEMPGHSLAALAAYPQLSCKGGHFEVGTTWGVYDDVYCPKEETFKFLEDVLDEVCELFPGTYIHIGGDECKKTRWTNCSNCQARMKSEGLKSENELQSYFIRRIEKYLNAKGKQIIGWDEILEGGLAPNAAVMSWRGMSGGIAAAAQKHIVVMSPGKPCYFDHYQSKDRAKEPLAIGGFNSLEKVYDYDPVPVKMPAADKEYILGAQGNVWTEYIADFAHVEYMSIPRMCALSEALWSPAASKNYPDFITRLKVHAKLLDKMNVNYAKHFLSEPIKK